MKHKTYPIVYFLILLAQSLWAGPIEIPLSQRTRFKLISENPKVEPETLTEHLTLGKKRATFFSLLEKKKVFLSEPPQLDSCGMVHFLLMNDEGETADIYCVPQIFPRCGAGKLPTSSPISVFLTEQIQNNAQCQIDLFLEAGLTESYKIQMTPRS